MANWSDVESYLKLSYKCQEPQDGTLRLLFELDGGRSQFISVSRMTRGDGIDFAVLATPFSESTDLDWEHVLTEAGDQPFGGVVILFGTPHLRHVVPLAHLDVDELLEPMHMLLRSGDVLEAAFTGADTL